MDDLKKEIEAKRQRLAEETGGKKRYFNRAEMEKKQIQKKREEERRELEAKAKAKRQFAADSTASAAATASTSKPNPNAAATAASGAPSRALTDEEKIDMINIPRPEVIRRLRILKQPITLFGEDDEARLDRLKHVLKTGMFEVDSDMTEGQTNDFLRDIAELRKRQKSGIVSDRKRKNSEVVDGVVEDGEGGVGDDELDGDGGSSGADVERDMKLMKANFDELCDEDKILVFFKRLLSEWKQELGQMTAAERRAGKKIATLNQCARYLHPLFKFCRKKVLPDDIRRALMVVVDCCMKRDYLAAMDQYIKMAIGNAPWPIGVTMVGIHERSAREKIYTNSVAHIMNDETTRKYLQSVKRLMTFCQRRYPTMPSKAVEFNSLANGSDLQSLLQMETDSGSSKVFEERLRLMPAP
ncbi:uncharacterized protein LOC126784837 [Argentina anserina]|uniref:uncharacterized protein LOC126784837 n=1 Tax=Argentina anserina TaxID=57926 RepID=UPI0021765A48|nr:uncharacterized protein LOC126784837 [Potentilla anserina]